MLPAWTGYLPPMTVVSRGVTAMKGAGQDYVSDLVYWKRADLPVGFRRSVSRIIAIAPVRFDPIKEAYTRDVPTI